MATNPKTQNNKSYIVLGHLSWRYYKFIMGSFLEINRKVKRDQNSLKS